MNPIIKLKKLGFQWETSDPFLFCVHHEDYYPEGNGKFGPDPVLLKGRNIGQDFEGIDGWRMYHGESVPGFPGHPHRGFETVTVVQKGTVDHSDSMGAAGRYAEGDVQWLTAGKGIQHSEMFPLLKEKDKNTLELFQIWLNLPSYKKFSEPCFKMLWSEDIPVIKHLDKTKNSTYIKLVAGSLDGMKPVSPPPDSWASVNDSFVWIWIIDMDKGSSWTIPTAIEGLNRTLYYFRGNGLTISDLEIPNYHGIELKSNVDVVLKNGNEPAKLLLLQGKPINEPVSQYGPFVMNTQTEIQQAFMDYQSTHFGGWPWPSSDPTHGKEKGRFAKHSDGKIEKKN